MSFRQRSRATFALIAGLLISRTGKIRGRSRCKAVADYHSEWLKSVEKRAGLGELNPQPYWGFDDLKNKAGTKLLNCFYVQAAARKEEGVEFSL
jgi:MvaI/BcnI restriction endonuclease family